LMPFYFRKECPLNSGYLSYPISKVAKVCGYASISYFTYVFRRYFGVSPSQYSQRSSESKILTHQGI
ncbi:AraC family transcriptional regulator, partial [Shigella dysenteriae]|uniref:AraC family transcriptional regulator n=1 Tax=Shigella dysenteriae TaxID=622 RepID=UPI000E5CA4A6